MKLSELKANPNNPRLIKDAKFQLLVKSIQDFPEMMEKRPIVVVTDVDGKMYPLGGNMRLKALQELKFNDIPDTWVVKADEWTAEQRQEFVIKDNVGFGEWDWEQLEAWDSEQLEDWGLDVPKFDDASEQGDIVELDKITTTFNINIKCDSPDELEEMKFKLGITANSIHSTMLMGLLA